MQRLRSPQNCRQSLQGHTRNVVHRLLRRQRDARSLRMEAHQPSALVLCAKALFYYLTPNFARCAVLCDLFKEIVMRVEEEAEPRAKFIHIESAAARPLNVLDTVIQSECQLLQCGRSRLADVIPAD